MLILVTKWLPCIKFLQSFILIFLIMKMVCNLFKTKCKGYILLLYYYVVDPNTVQMTIALHVLFCFYPSVTLQCFVLDQCIL